MLGGARSYGWGRFFFGGLNGHGGHVLSEMSPILKLFSEAGVSRPFPRYRRYRRHPLFIRDFPRFRDASDPRVTPSRG